MIEEVFFAATIYGPVLVLCGIAVWWSVRTRHRGIERAMSLSALFWAIVMAAMLVFVIAAQNSCQGNALYGYQHCRIIPTSAANYSLVLVVMSIAGGVFYAGLLFSICGLLEYRWRKTPR